MKKLVLILAIFWTIFVQTLFAQTIPVESPKSGDPWKFIDKLVSSASQFQPTSANNFSSVFVDVMYVSLDSNVVTPGAKSAAYEVYPYSSLRLKFSNNIDSMSMAIYLWEGWSNDGLFIDTATTIITDSLIISNVNGYGDDSTDSWHKDGANSMAYYWDHNTTQGEYFYYEFVPIVGQSHTDSTIIANSKVRRTKY